MDKTNLMLSSKAHDYLANRRPIMRYWSDLLEGQSEVGAEHSSLSHKHCALERGDPGAGPLMVKVYWKLEQMRHKMRQLVIDLILACYGEVENEVEIMNLLRHFVQSREESSSTELAMANAIWQRTTSYILNGRQHLVAGRG